MKGDHLHNDCKVTFSCIFDQAQSRLLKRVVTNGWDRAVCPTYPIEEVYDSFFFHWDIIQLLTVKNSSIVLHTLQSESRSIDRQRSMEKRSTAIRKLNKFF